MIRNISSADVNWFNIFAMSNGYSQKLLLVDMLSTVNAPVDNSEMERIGNMEREKANLVYLLLVNYNHFHNILRLFDVLPNFPFIKSETMGDYYL